MVRHGEHITSWRVDSRTDSTLARLDDGSWVSARNHIDLPEATPGRRLVRRWAKYQQGQYPITPTDVRWMGKLAGWWCFGVAVVTGSAFAVIAATA